MTITKTTTPYEFLIRWTDGKISGAHIKFLETVADGTEILSVKEGEAQKVSLAGEVGFPIADVLAAITSAANTTTQAALDAVTSSQAAQTASEAAQAAAKAAADAMEAEKARLATLQAEKDAADKAAADKAAQDAAAKAQADAAIAAAQAEADKAAAAQKAFDDAVAAKVAELTAQPTTQGA